MIKRIHLSWFLVFVMGLACFSSDGYAISKRRKSASTTTPPGQFDYYVLSLSWGPNYCAGHPQDHSKECRSGEHVGFVLHGLWPQSSTGRPPLSCAGPSPVSAETARRMLEYFPDRGMVQHEWSTHGTCSGLSADEYFGKMEQAYTAIKVPDQFRSLDHSSRFPVKEIEKAFADANNAPPNAFRLSCHAGELVNVEACLTKDLQYQACTQSVHDCSSPQLLMRAVK